ncbi:uncharacterized protein si:ch73-6k14.2 [Etheostoma cragini]|uniref:uncharacterized protein si:ch73-6k14.2 n=1 Tax=Etheostoma cragini TaxID=417921 RepID=UPI00155E7335|nr:uncharacterized protein si:ch73-6k14.2 [Etheostoma cragini]
MKASLARLIIRQRLLLYTSVTRSVHAESLSESPVDIYRLLGDREENKGARELWQKKVERHRERIAVTRLTVIRKNHRDTSRMKPRCLLSTVDRLPTISEMQESNAEDEDQDCSTHTMEKYVDFIRELSQPAPYPLHGPLRGHRRWTVHTCPGVTPSSTYAPWVPVELSDISLTLTDQRNCDSSLRFNHNLLDLLVAQSLFAGLV